MLLTTPEPIRTLQRKQPKNIDAYSRANLSMREYFDFQIDNLSPAQLTDYVSDLMAR